MANFEFICGSAGTGKTFLARQRINDISRGSVLAATTGIAAVNLGDAVTINSLLKYYDTKSLHEQHANGRLDNRLVKLYNDFGIKEIIIDEVSMLSAQQLDIICGALDFFNDIKPERQISLTLVGDFAQLPPVKAEFAFEASCWDRFDKNTLKLRKIHRQTDGAFIDALIAARIGDGDKAAKFFTPHFVKTSDNDFIGTTIVSKNVEVDDFNAYRLGQISKPTQRFVSTRTGKELKEWKNIPKSLEVKEDALVMILANNYSSDGEINYVNGDLGYFMEKINERAAFVRLLRTGEIVKVVGVQRNNQEKVGSTMKTVGDIKYMPLRLGWATTVHKSQGLTLDKVQINIRNPFMAYPGMLYVALSRARSSDGIRIVGTPQLMRKRCKTEPKVERWL